MRETEVSHLTDKWKGYDQNLVYRIPVPHCFSAKLSFKSFPTIWPRTLSSTTTKILSRAENGQRLEKAQETPTVLGRPRTRASEGSVGSTSIGTNTMHVTWDGFQPYKPSQCKGARCKKAKPAKDRGPSTGNTPPKLWLGVCAQDVV